MRANESVKKVKYKTKFTSVCAKRKCPHFVSSYNKITKISWGSPGCAKLDRPFQALEKASIMDGYCVAEEV